MSTSFSQAFMNRGEEYRKYADRELWVPASAEDRPDPDLLEWYADTVFRG